MTTAAIYDFNTKKQIPEKTLTYADCMMAMNHAVAPDYLSGNESGKAAALAYLKYLSSENYFSGGGLQSIVFNLAEKLAEAKSDAEIDGIRGKIVGVFAFLDTWLRFAVKSGTTNEFRDATWQTIQASLQDASEGGPLKRAEDRQKAIRSEKCRQAAKARWGKRETLKER